MWKPVVLLGIVTGMGEEVTERTVLSPRESHTRVNQAGYAKATLESYAYPEGGGVIVTTSAKAYALVAGTLSHEIQGTVESQLTHHEVGRAQTRVYVLIWENSSCSRAENIWSLNPGTIDTKSVLEYEISRTEDGVVRVVASESRTTELEWSDESTIRRRSSVFAKAFALLLDYASSAKVTGVVSSSVRTRAYPIATATTRGELRCEVLPVLH